jgi:uncharacterized protein YxjI
MNFRRCERHGEVRYRLDGKLNVIPNSFTVRDLTSAYIVKAA